MTLYGAIFEKFMNDNIGKRIKIHIRDLPDTIGTLVAFGKSDILIDIGNGKRCVIDDTVVIGICEVDETE